jgi:ABC-type polysaccharide/polyol phosphate transport system ATPase subunit
VSNPNFQSIKDLFTQFSGSSLFVKKEVIKGVSLDIYPGEVIGILGRNGTGKSTLLKAVAGILTPDAGEIIVKGNIAPMLAIGTGIELELSGYENIKLLGALMGLSRKRVKEMFAEIIDFSELSHETLLAPVKTYSSGMMARLSFSIAICEVPEIMIIDEVLAVGDAGFQKKCMDRITQIKNSGSTILFVSHSLADVQRICTRGICLNEGVIASQGDLHKVGLYYNSLFNV